MIKRFFIDLQYGYPAFSNLKWEIIENWREKHGYYKMKELPQELIMKYADILVHKHRIIPKKDLNRLIHAIDSYNEVIGRI